MKLNPEEVGLYYWQAQRWAREVSTEG